MANNEPPKMDEYNPYHSTIYLDMLMVRIIGLKARVTSYDNKMAWAWGDGLSKSIYKVNPMDVVELEALEMEYDRIQSNLL